MDDPEEYGQDEAELEDEAAEEDNHEEKEEIPQTLAAGPVSEKDLIMAKLAKLRKANKMGNLEIFCISLLLIIKEFCRDKRPLIEMPLAKEKWKNRSTLEKSRAKLTKTRGKPLRRRKSSTRNSRMTRKRKSRLGSAFLSQRFIL